MKTILIVDDSETARVFIRKCFTIALQHDVCFLEAGDGQNALKTLKESMVDLICTDLTMPGMDGVDLLKHILASPRHNNTPLIVITSAGNAAKENELLKIGALAVIPKPITPAMLVQALAPLWPEPEGETP